MAPRFSIFIDFHVCMFNMIFCLWMVTLIFVCPSIHGRVFYVFHRFVTRGVIIILGFLLDLLFPSFRILVHPFIRVYDYYL